MAKQLNIAIVDVGSNIQPEKHLKLAKALIARHHRLLGKSSVVRTAPLGDPNQSDYLNCAWKIATVLDRESFKAFLKATEEQLGREKSSPPHAPRTIDLDLIVWNNQVVHRNFLERDFVRRYTLEIAPELADSLPAHPIPRS
ncbi:MAG TPA: 2-amino-4-hydroxy-6-hydroxymethyldihydropteridine diphosphokinase [Atribacteraceae bacterium]|nr:2-amino-4-hydroxy-6-hydroxymethyldihydropteridine diphosphokinase [Atribacteraceae bacterium]